MAARLSTTKEAFEAFCNKLAERGIAITQREKVPARSPLGYMVHEDRVHTASREVFHVKIRPKGPWVPKKRSEVGAGGQELAERYEFVLNTFGNGDESFSGLNEDTMLQLLELSERGFTPYLVTIYPATGLFLWINAKELYEFVMAYGTLPQRSFQGNEGQTLVSVPTGYLHPWTGLIVGPPSVAEEPVNVRNRS